MSEFNSDAIEERGKEKAPRSPKGGGNGGRGNADWQSAQYKESNGGKNATEGNKEDGGAVSKFNSDAINKIKNQKYLHICKKNSTFAAENHKRLQDKP